MKKNKLTHTEENKINERLFRLEVFEYSEDAKVLSFYCRIYEKNSQGQWTEIYYCEPLGPIIRPKVSNIPQTSYQKNLSPNPGGTHAPDVAELGWKMFQQTI